MSRYSIIVTTVQVSLIPLRRSYSYLIRSLPPDLGKILAGIQVPPNENEQFQRFLDQLGYDYVEETDNEIYKRYLQG